MLFEHRTFVLSAFLDETPKAQKFYVLTAKFNYKESIRIASSLSWSRENKIKSSHLDHIY